MNTGEKLFISFLFGLVIGASASYAYMRLITEKEKEESEINAKMHEKAIIAEKVENLKEAKKISEECGYLPEEGPKDDDPKDHCIFLNVDDFYTITADPRTNCEGDYTWFVKDDIIVNDDDDKFEKDYVFDDPDVFNNLTETEYYIYNPHRKAYYALCIEYEDSYNDPEDLDYDDPYE